jgi:hypothetical protein
MRAISTETWMPLRACARAKAHNVQNREIRLPIPPVENFPGFWEPDREILSGKHPKSREGQGPDVHDVTRRPTLSAI